MGEYIEKTRRISVWEFSQNQPKPKRKITSKIERVQPYVVGLKANGDFKWEGKEMPRWQQEMFRAAVNVFHYLTQTMFGSRWNELTKYENGKRDQDEAGNEFFLLEAQNGERIRELKTMYPSNSRRRAQGD
jgi:hypothetical protein